MVVADTDLIVALLRNDKTALSKIASYEEKNEPIHITIFSLFELSKGAYNSSNPEKARDYLREMLMNIIILDFTLYATDIAAKNFRKTPNVNLIIPSA